MDVRICVLLLVLGGANALTGKGLFCRDPDTGKLYPPNSTWKATSFCGNYTCRLKKKEMPSKPLREFKVSELNPSIINNDTKEIIDSGQENQLPNVETNESRFTDLFNKLKENITDVNDKIIVNDIINDANRHDRYLNEKEIKMIADMLHGVKKSDIETVVDIYNIAQDIYKELDDKDEIIKDAEPQIPEKEKENPPKKRKPHKTRNHLVYGFEPMHNSQRVMTEIKDQESGTEAYDKQDHNLEADVMLITNKSEKLVDMHKEGSDLEPTIINPRSENGIPNYNSPLINPSYVKMPYYYDLSDFQRYSSYVYPRPVVNPEKVSPITDNSIKKSTEQRTTDVKQYSLLPYPYYQVRYNGTGFPYSYFYSVNPYQNVYRKDYSPYYVSRVAYTEGTIKKGKSPENTITPPSLSNTPESNSITSKSPSWKTESLSEDVIDEIRANFESKHILFKPLCLKKKIKLEKVGKVFKWDDMNREKRSTVQIWPKFSMNDDYEVYIEKIICKSDVDPGFFRMGNTSAPFPACCPQRITR